MEPRVPHSTENAEDSDLAIRVSSRAYAATRASSAVEHQQTDEETALQMRQANALFLQVGSRGCCSWGQSLRAHSGLFGELA